MDDANTNIEAPTIFREFSLVLILAPLATIHHTASFPSATSLFTDRSKLIAAKYDVHIRNTYKLCCTILWHSHYICMQNCRVCSYRKNEKCSFRNGESTHTRGTNRWEVRWHCLCQSIQSGICFIELWSRLQAKINCIS